MDPKTFVIIGAKGQLGTALKQKYPESIAVDREELDISSHAAVQSFDWSAAATILNVAAYTNVDGAETVNGRIAAWQVNAQAVANLADIARQKDLLLVHISTDYVFDGNRKLHTEDEPLSPLSSYGASKAAGDLAAMTVPKHYILRTSGVIGEGKNFVRTMLELGNKGINPRVVSNQVGRPTFTPQLVDAIDYLLTNSCQYGLYNISNDGDEVSWADLARAIYTEAGLAATVTNITTEEYFKDKPEAAKRPLNSSFDLSKIKSTGLQLRDWRADLSDYIKKERQ